MAKPTDWNVKTDGQRGDIKLDYVPFNPPPKRVPAPSTIPAGLYQVIFFRTAIAVGGNPTFERIYISIENEGPADMKIWADKGLHPESMNIVPDIVLGVGQSVTILVSNLVLVRPVDKSIQGNYAISWCCGTILSGVTQRV